MIPSWLSCTRLFSRATPRSSPFLIPPSLRLRPSTLHSRALTTLSTMTASVSTSTRKSAPPPVQLGNFDLVTCFTPPYAQGITLEKWVSRQTGLAVFWADFPSPMLECNIVLATEIFNDSGCPHTLEHLVFLGSEKYPYKGILDTLANRAFANGTNAWTATDHTAYTLTTAGSEGFLRMLPIYCDHVFFPTLTAEGFTTEVYHVDGRAREAGVVFSEMQGRENSSGDLMELERTRALFPQSSAYRSETGGLMANLRKLDVETIRKYHHTYYAPHNAAIFLAGPLDRQALFEQLHIVEQNFVEHGIKFGPKGPEGWKRPFVESASAEVPVIKPDTDNRKVVEVPFPDEDESIGEVDISWITPPVTDWLTHDALDLIGTYLSESAIAPLNKEFVERPDPKFSSLSFYDEEYARCTSLSCYLKSVATKDLATIDTEVVRFLSGLADKADISLDRMHTEIKREKLRVLEQIESAPQSYLSDMIVPDFLYGDRSGKDLQELNNVMDRLTVLDTWTAQQWADLIKKYLIHNPRLVVLARPSAKMASDLRAEGKAGLKERKEKYGKEGLERLGEKLDAARRANDVPIPEEIITEFKIPSPSTIHWIPVGTGRALPAPDASIPGLGEDVTSLDSQVQAHLDTDETALPFFVQFDHINSAFLTITLVFNTHDVPAELYPVLGLFKSTLFSLPVQRQDGTEVVLSKEEVIEKLNVDTLEYAAMAGVHGFPPETFGVEIRAEASKYRIVIAWLRDILTGGQFVPEELEISLRKQLKSLPNAKRDGHRVEAAVLNEMTLDSSRSTIAQNTLFARMVNLPAQLALISPEDGQGKPEPERLVDQLRQLREHLLQPRNLRAHVAGDILSLDKPKQDWAEARFGRPAWWDAPGGLDLTTAPVDSVKTVRSEVGSNPAGQVVVCAVPSIESSYATFVAKGPDSYAHPDAPALTVAVGVLNALEGFLWRFIRGAGLAYGASLAFSPSGGYVRFHLMRSPNAADAYLEACRLLRALSGDASALREGEKPEIDDKMVQSAKSSLVCGVAEENSSGPATAEKTFIETALAGVGKNFGRRSLAAMEGVTVADVQKAIATYLVPIFDPSRSLASIAAAPDVADKIQTQLTKAGYHVSRRELAADDKGDDSDGSDESGAETGSDEDTEMSDNSDGSDDSDSSTR